MCQTYNSNLIVPTATPIFLADRFWDFGRLLKVLDGYRFYSGRLGQVLKVLKGFKRLLRAQGGHNGPQRWKNVMLLYRGPKLASLMKKGKKAKKM